MEAQRGASRCNPHRIKDFCPQVRPIASGQLDGRIYDYALGRFLSVDPIIQFPENSQSLNPYSYILNNPLSGTDPTGYCVAETGTRIKHCETATITATTSGGATLTASRQVTAGTVQRLAISVSSNGAVSVGVGGAGRRNEQQKPLADRMSISGVPANLVAQNGGMSDAEYNDIMGEDNPRQRMREAAAQGQAFAEGGEATLNAINPADPKNLAYGLAGAIALKGAFRWLGRAFGKFDEVVRHGPMNPGPLALDVVKSFRSGTYSARTLSSDKTFYRVISDNGNPTGRFWTSDNPRGPLQSIIDSALDQNWRNSATRVVRARVPAGTTVYDGSAAAQRGLVGGGNQVYIPRVDSSWIQQ